MANEFYTPSGVPATGASGRSADMRAEFVAVEAALDKLPTMSTNTNEIVVVNGAGTALVTIPSVTVALGGTAIASYAVGDILYASGTTTLSKLAKGTAYQNLGMNAGATAPQWQASLQSIFTTQGDMVYASTANTPVRLAKGTASQQLRMNAGATAPEWFTPTVASTNVYDDQTFWMDN